MSGSFISTGKETNNGDKKLEIENLLSYNIESLIIYSIPLFHKSLNLILFGKFWKYLKFSLQLFSPIFSSCSNLSHIAIQLNLKNDDIIIIEYGQYLTKDSKKKNNLFSTSGSSKNPRKETNENIYYYINKDGVRLTKINKRYYNIIPHIIASDIYNINLNNKKNIIRYNILKQEFKTIECYVRNRISLGELISNFKDEKWEAKNYNILTHNCQHFGAEVIKILNAIIKNGIDPIDAIFAIPNCIIEVMIKKKI